MGTPRRLADYSSLEQELILHRVATVFAQFPTNERNGHTFYQETDVRVIARLMKIPVHIVTDAMVHLN